jgi:hypothetical protein
MYGRIPEWRFLERTGNRNHQDDGKHDHRHGPEHELDQPRRNPSRKPGADQRPELEQGYVTEHTEAEQGADHEHHQGAGAK